MRNLTDRIKQETRKKFIFWEESTFKAVEAISKEQLDELESSLAFKFPLKVKMLLIELGHGYINDFLIHGVDGIHQLDEENGKIAGFFCFASDDCGNQFAFSPESKDCDLIYYCCHDPAGYNIAANNAEDLLGILIDSGFNIKNHVSKLELLSL